jgi:hypothetical protein
MAPPQFITVINPLPWPRSTVMAFSLHELENGGQLAPNVGGQPAARIVPPPTDREPNPPYGYVVSFIRFHECGFAALASRFLRGLCYHYGVELHNFTSNAISQAATFVGVCEGFVGIPVNWDLWVHLFRAELHTLVTPEPWVRHAVRAGGVSISLRETRRELYIPCTMTSNNTEWEWGWFYLRKNEPGLRPYTGKVVKEKADSWWHGVSPSSRQDWLESALLALKNLADAGLGAASVLAKLHHWQIIPLMERWLCIFEMIEAANPVALSQSRLLPDLLPQEYAATRARRAINLKAVRHDNDDLWSFVMLPHGPLVSGISVFSPRFSPAMRRRGLTSRSSPTAGDRERRTVRPAHAPSPSACACGAAAGTRAGGVQEGEEDSATGAPGAEE